MKKLVKLILAGMLFQLGLWRLLFAIRGLFMRSRPAFILMYHRVMPREANLGEASWTRFRSLPGIVVSPEMFRRQMAFLRERFDVITLETLIDKTERKKQFDRPSVVITFDDGWRDNYDHAFPPLRDSAMPATIFLTTGFIGTTRLFWPERLLYTFGNGERSRLSVSELPQDLMTSEISETLSVISSAGGASLERHLDTLIGALKSAQPGPREALMAALSRQLVKDNAEQSGERVMLDWDEVEIMRQGGVEFGSHGVNHELLTEISEDATERELADSLGVIRSRLNPGLLSLAYPNGNYNEVIKKRAANLGYRCAVTVERGIVTAESDVMALPRINIHDDVSMGLTGNFSASLFAWHICRSIF